MKKTFFKTVVATAVVAATLALSSVVAFAAAHTLTADGDGLTAGETDGYFTASAACAYKSSGGSDTFVLTKKGANYIYFVPEGNGTVTVSFASTGSSNESVIDLCTLDGTTLTSQEQLSVVGTAPLESTFTATVSAGTTYAIANLGTARDTRVASITVEEEGSASYPDFYAADTDTTLDGGKSDTATLDAGITNLAAGNTTGTVDDLADTTTIAGFTVYGSVVEDVFNGMTIEANSKTYEGTTYANRLKTNGVGEVGKYAISFSVDKDSTVEVIGMSGNSSSIRPLVIATADGTELAEYSFGGSALSKATFSVTEGTYYLYAGNCISGSNGGINIYDIKVYDGVTYKLPVVTLTNSGVTDGKLYLTASVNKDFTAGTVTGIGFVLAKPNATTTTNVACNKYKTTDDAYVFTGVLSEQALKAQAYVTFTSVVDGTEVTRYSNTVVNVVE